MAVEAELIEVEKQKLSYPYLARYENDIAFITSEGTGFYLLAKFKSVGVQMTNFHEPSFTPPLSLRISNPPKRLGWNQTNRKKPYAYLIPTRSRVTEYTDGLRWIERP